MNSEEIIYITPLAKYQMKWDEVEDVEMDLQRGNLIFYSDNRNKRLAVLGPRNWSGEEREDMTRLLFNETKRRQIKLKSTIKATLTMSKNSKLR